MVKVGKKHLLSLGEIFQFLIERGHSLNDLTHTYTIDQVYLFYEKAKKIEMDNHRMMAIIFGKAVYCMSPSYSKKEASTKSNEWKTFMDKLDFDKITKPKDVGRMLSMAGIPIINNPKKKKQGAEQ